MKAVVDRVVQYPHRYQLKNVNTSEVLGTFDLEPITGTISVVGTKIDKELFDSIASDIADRLVSNGGDAKDNVITYTMANNRSNIVSGEKLSVSFGKISKYFNDLKAVAFSGDRADIGLGNVDNTSDANKPVSTAQQQALNLKANASDVYTKTETDGLLNDKANTNDVYSKTKTDELLNNKANKSDVYTKTETNGLLNDKANANNVYTKTEADELLNNKANKSDVYTKAETDTSLNNKANSNDVYTKSETDNKINEPLYNLGYYDTITANSDGTYTITRKTGYLAINAEDITGGTYNVANSSNAYCTTIVKNYNKCIYNWDKIIGISSNGFEVRCLDFSWNKSNTIGINNDNNIYLAFSTTKTKAEIQALCPISIQYKLATSYTEKVEKNHYATYNQRFILEHNKSEAERSCNLLNTFDRSNIPTASSLYNATLNSDGSYTSTKTSDSRAWTYSNSDFKMRLTKGTYYLSVTGTISTDYNVAIEIYDNNNKLLVSTSRTNNFKASFNLSSDTDVGIICKIYNSSNIKIMLNEGTTPLPYQPYEGKVVHEKELESASVFTKLGNKTNFSFDSGSYLVVANNGMVTVTGTDPLNVGSSAMKKYVGIFMVTIAEYGGGQSVCVNTEEVFLGEAASATISGPRFTIYKLN